MHISGVELSDTARETDNDIEKALNLLFELPHDQYAYPKFSFESTEKTLKPKVMVVADSYWWNVFSTGNTTHVFNGCDFWYYNAEVHHDNGSPMQYSGDLNLLAESQKVTFIIILSTEANLYKFGWGFIEQLYDKYHQGWSALASQFTEDQIQGQINFIRNDPDWLALIKKKAEENRVPIDTQLRNDAVYMLSRP
jgi:hypothetical protein